jgi:hypothetical protein
MEARNNLVRLVGAFYRRVERRAKSSERPELA